MPIKLTPEQRAERRAASLARYKAKNADAIRARSREWAEANKGNVDKAAKAEYNRAYAQANPRKRTPEQQAESNRKHYEKNAERLRAEKLAAYHANGDRLTPEERSAYNKQYRADNPDKCKRTPEEQAKSYARFKILYNTDPKTKERKIANGKKWRDGNPMKVQKMNLKKKYGITQEDVARMLVEQGHKCPGCKIPDEGKPRVFPYVDHDHATGFVRGLLCGRCNFAIGLADDDPDILIALAEYLRAAKRRQMVAAAACVDLSEPTKD